MHTGYISLFFFYKNWLEIFMRVEKTSRHLYWWFVRSSLDEIIPVLFGFQIYVKSFMEINLFKDISDVNSPSHTYHLN